MKSYLLIAAAVALSGCGGAKQVINQAPEPDEKLIWSSSDKRPMWTVNEPEAEGDKMIFIGMSGKFAMEKDARDDAQNHAISNVVKYLGTFVNSKIEKAKTNYGLSSDIVDPTNIGRSIEEQLSKAFATRVKPIEWYIEKWQNKLKETYYVVYVKTGVPKSVIDEELKNALNGSIEDLKKKRDAASEEKAKKQFENAINAFEEMKNKGFTLE